MSKVIFSGGPRPRVRRFRPRKKSTRIRIPTGKKSRYMIELARKAGVDQPFRYLSYLLEQGPCAT